MVPSKPPISCVVNQPPLSSQPQENMCGVGAGVEEGPTAAARGPLSVRAPPGLRTRLCAGRRLPELRHIHAHARTSRHLFRQESEPPRIPPQVYVRSMDTSWFPVNFAL